MIYSKHVFLCEVIEKKKNNFQAKKMKEYIQKRILVEDSAFMIKKRYFEDRIKGLTIVPKIKEIALKKRVSPIPKFKEIALKKRTG